MGVGRARRWHNAKEPAIQLRPLKPTCKKTLTSGFRFFAIPNWRNLNKTPSNQHQEQKNAREKNNTLKVTPYTVFCSTPLHKNSPQWHLPQISTHQSQIWNGKFQTTSLSWLMSMVKEGKGYSGKNMADKYIGKRKRVIYFLDMNVISVKIWMCLKVDVTYNDESILDFIFQRTLHSNKIIENNVNTYIYIYTYYISRERRVVGNELGQSFPSLLKRDDEWCLEVFPQLFNPKSSSATLLFCPLHSWKDERQP